jgi:hypothetical protein
MYKHNRRLVQLILILVAGCLLSGVRLGRTSQPGPMAGKPVVATDLTASAPSASGAFIFDETSNSYHTFGNGVNFRLQPHGVTVLMSSGAVDLTFVGANPDVRLSGHSPLATKANIFIGNDPATWRREAPMVTEIVYHGLYTGIDVSYTVQDGRLKSDFHLQPGADLDLVRLRFSDDARLTLRDGTLEIQLPDGKLLREHIPSSYQDIDGWRHPVDVAFRLLDDHTYTFALQGPYDPAHALVIDPVLVYSTFLGGSGRDEGWAIAADDTGALYVTGITQSLDFPLTQPGDHAPGNDVFVAKIGADGNLVYVSIFGGSSGEEGNAIGVDGAGNAYVGGETFSPDFPILNAWQPYFAGYEDAFVLKVDPNGDLVYSTFLGGSRAEEINDIYVDTVGNVYVGGEVYSDDFPLLNPWSDKTYGPDDEDGFISIFNAHGQLVYSTYISASQRDQVFRIAVDRDGYVYGTGMTSSPDFPLVNPLQATYGGDWDDAFVFKLDPWTNTMVYSTFLGGSGRDEGWGLAVDDTGAAYVTGFTISPNFPVVNAFQPQYKGHEEVFVSKLSPSGDALLFSTFVGGSDKDQAWGLDLDGAGNVYLTGETYSADFPLRNALQPHHSGGQDAFLMVLSSQGELIYSSFLGGSGRDRGWRLTVDRNWRVHITGSTNSPNFPVRAAYQAHHRGETDAFVSTFALVPTPTPTPTPVPHTSAQVGPEGGSLWLSYPAHLTLLRVPPGALTAATTFELTYDGRPDMQGALQGINHFFQLGIWDPQRLTLPIQVYLGYQETRGLIADSIGLYRLEGSEWVTSAITVTEQTRGHLAAWIHLPGVYGVLGETQRVYMPLVLRQ